MGTPTIAAACVNEAGVSELSVDEAIAKVRSVKAPIWIHVDGSQVEAAKRFLTDGMGFHELAIEDALSQHERPSLSEYDDHIFLVAPAISSQNDVESYVEIAFFVSEKYVVTVAPEPCSVIDAQVNRWSQHIHASVGAADVLHTLLDAIVDDYLPIMDEIEDRVDDMADTVFSGKVANVVQLLSAKRRLLAMRRRISPLREVVNSLLRRDIEIIPDRVRPYFQDVYDHAFRVAESIDMQRDALTSLLDVHLSTVSNNLNEVMKKLTVISTVLGIGALVVGFYGMNVALPETHWPFGEWFVIGVMFVASAIVLALFKRKNWL